MEKTKIDVEKWTDTYDTTETSIEHLKKLGYL